MSTHDIAGEDLMSKGKVTHHNKDSGRLKFEVSADGSGKRRTRCVTVKGTRHDAPRDLTRLMSAAGVGTPWC